MVGRGQDWLRPLDCSQPSCWLRRETRKKSPIGIVSQAQDTPERGCLQSPLYPGYSSSARGACPNCVGCALPEWRGSPAAPGLRQLSGVLIPAEWALPQMTQPPAPGLFLFLCPGLLGPQVQDHRKPFLFSPRHQDPPPVVYLASNMESPAGAGGGLLLLLMRKVQSNLQPSLELAWRSPT